MKRLMCWHPLTSFSLDGVLARLMVSRVRETRGNVVGIGASGDAKPRLPLQL